MKRKKCRVSRGLLLPCETLGMGLENGQGRGVRLHHLVSMRTGETTRTFVTLRSGDLSRNGAVLNFCPFCGCSIGHHISTKARQR